MHLLPCILGSTITQVYVHTVISLCQTVCQRSAHVVYIFGGVRMLIECDMQASSHDLCTIL